MDEAVDYHIIQTKIWEDRYSMFSCMHSVIFEYSVCVCMMKLEKAFEKRGRNLMGMRRK